MAQRKYTFSSDHTTSTRYTRHSAESYDSHSTAATSLSDSTRPSTKDSSFHATKPHQSASYGEDLSPSTSLHSRDSIETYSSEASLPQADEIDVEDYADYDEIPALPVYRHEIEETNVRPSTPEEFSALFPSLNRLTIRHDDFTSDGNLNLRVDTVVSGRRRKTIQLFHMRMYDLNKREFSLRRYCRDSGREVCNSKRKYVDAPASSRPLLTRSMSSAVKSLTGSTKGRPGTSYSTETDESSISPVESSLSLDGKTKSTQLPTNTIKLEYSNYARVDVNRRGSQAAKRYEFQWWGHNYAWKRVADKHTGAVAFHLIRDGNNNLPVAHIVPETRSPNQVEADERAGGWVPPSHMWISDRSLVDAMTDVAE